MVGGGNAPAGAHCGCAEGASLEQRSVSLGWAALEWPSLNDCNSQLPHVVQLNLKLELQFSNYKGSL